MRRRDFLSNTIAAMGGVIAFPRRGETAGPRNILEFGANPDGKTMNTKAIQHAIDAVFQAGGGNVVVPSGVFLTGLLELKSKVTLNLAQGSTLLGSTSMDDYKFGSSSGHDGPNPRHLIFAMNASDISIRGAGRIDGQGPSFWEPSGSGLLTDDHQWGGVASHDLVPKKAGHPSPMLLFVNCRRLAIQDIHLQNSPGWTLHTINCDEVDIHGISIQNPVNGPNTDGIDITGCQNVTVSDCFIEAGDDAICLKSQNPFGPEPRLVKNVSVINCHLSTCCNGFKIGTETEGGFENITFSDSVISNKEVPYRERVIAGLALEIVDGGWIDGVIVKNIQMQRSRTPIFIRLGNRKRTHENPQHGIRNVSIENLQATEALVPSSITGLPGMEIKDVTLSHIRLQNALQGNSDLVKRPIPEKDGAYPEARMFGMLPASGLYVRHARNLRLNDLTLTTLPGEGRPALVFDDVIGARLSGIQSSPIKGKMPSLLQNNSRDVQILQQAG